MGKKIKVVNVGAPAYMNQYSALMILLLAFFIVLVSMSSFQESGFKAGVGEIRNAFNLGGGNGMFHYSFLGHGAGYSPNNRSDERGDPGVDRKLLIGEGGTGETDVKVDDADHAKYIRFRLSNDFPPRSAYIPEKLGDELKKIGVGFGLFDFTIQIRSYSLELGNAEKDKNLALERASKIMQALEKFTGVPYSKMSCAGYSDGRYFTATADKKFLDDIKMKASKQGTYIYIFTKNDKKTK